MPARTSQDATTVRTLRRGIGIVGIGLPFALTVGNLAFGHGWPGSMSGTYYTEMRNVFVGGLWAIGVFLICYRYGRLDDVLSTIAGVFAIAVAIFPTTPDNSTTEISSGDKMIGYIHFSSALVLFLLLATFCLVLFTRTDPAKKPTGRKRVRNRVYRICGIVILAALALAGAGNLLSESAYDALKPLMIGEALAVLAFGLAWLVKGETMFKDSQADLTPDGDPDPAPDPRAETESAAALP